MIRYANWITRDMLRARPDTLFVFGDNMEGWGFGGQAKEMRGEPNAVGIPTKWRPSMNENSFFIDSDLPAVQGLILERFKRLAEHLDNGGAIVWPSTGVGGGLAGLPQRAPRIWAFIETLKQSLER